MSGPTSTTTPYSRRKASRVKKAAARSALYRLLSLGFLYPDPETLALLRSGTEEAAACLELLGYGQALPALGQARDALPLTPEGWEGEYLGALGHSLAPECPPYETEYQPAHIFQKSQDLADVAGFYHAFGLEVAPQARERPDHLSLELEFMHFLAWKEAYALEQGHGMEKIALCRQAQRKFLQEHLGWVSLFVQRLAQKAEGSFLAAWGHLAKDFLALEAQALRVSLQEPALGQGTPGEGAGEEECASCPYAAPDEEGGVAPCPS